MDLAGVPGSTDRINISDSDSERTQISRDGICDLIKQSAVYDGINTAMVRLWIK